MLAVFPEIAAWPAGAIDLIPMSGEKAPRNISRVMHFLHWQGA
jgi:hypothetical protein